MSGPFIPKQFLSTIEALAAIASHRDEARFAACLAAFDGVAAKFPASYPRDRIGYPAEMLTERQSIFHQAEIDLRQMLYDGMVQATYVDPIFKAETVLASAFWATPDAEGVLLSGEYFPFGRPRFYSREPAQAPVPLRILKADMERALKPPPEAASSDCGTGARSRGNRPIKTDRVTQTDSVPAVSDALPGPVQLAEEPEAAALTLSKPLGKDRKIAGVRIALRELSLAPNLSAKVRGTAVKRWLEQRGWDVPKAIERSIDRALKS